MLTGEAARVLDQGPDLFIRQLPAKSNHTGPGRSVFDYPKDFPFRPMAPESMVPEIARRRFQLGRQRPIAVPIFPMTVKAGALAVIERLTLLVGFRVFRLGGS